MPSKRKPAVKKAATLAPVEEQAPVQEEVPEPAEETNDVPLDELDVVMATVASQLPAQVSEDVRVLAETVRASAGTRDVRFELAPGVVCMFGYSGLSRVMPAHRYVHIATEDELAEMSDRQIYDAVRNAK